MTSDRSPKQVIDLQEHRDRTLIAKISAGDEPAFATLFREYGSASLGLAVRILGDRALAEEVIQEVFLAVWAKASRYDAARGSVRTWVLTQVHHRAVDAVRREEAERRRNANQTPEVNEYQIDEVIEESWIASRREDVRAAIGTLPQEQRLVIELAYFGGLTQMEVAERAGIPLGTVKSRTLAAMKRLRGALAGGES